MDDKLKYFIGDLLDFAGSGNWNEFEAFAKEKGYSKFDIDFLLQQLEEFLED